MWDTLSWIIGTPIIIGLAVLVVKRIRQVNEAVRQHLENPGPIDPYASMAAMANVQQAIDEEKRRSAQAKALLQTVKRNKRKD